MESVEHVPHITAAPVPSADTLREARDRLAPAPFAGADDALHIIGNLEALLTLLATYGRIIFFGSAPEGFAHIVESTKEGVLHGFDAELDSPLNDNDAVAFVGNNF